MKRIALALIVLVGTLLIPADPAAAVARCGPYSFYRTGTFLKPEYEAQALGIMVEMGSADGAFCTYPPQNYDSIQQYAHMGSPNGNGWVQAGTIEYRNAPSGTSQRHYSFVYEIPGGLHAQVHRWPYESRPAIRIFKRASTQQGTADCGAQWEDYMEDFEDLGGIAGQQPNGDPFTNPAAAADPPGSLGNLSLISTAAQNNTRGHCIRAKIDGWTWESYWDPDLTWGAGTYDLYAASAANYNESDIPGFGTGPVTWNAHHELSTINGTFGGLYSPIVAQCDQWSLSNSSTRWNIRWNSPGYPNCEGFWTWTK